jgi:hypothetical protein
MIILLAFGCVCTFVIGSACVLFAQTIFGQVCGLILWMISAQLLVGGCIVETLNRLSKRAESSPVTKRPSVHSAPSQPTKTQRDAAWCVQCNVAGVATVEMGRTIYACPSCAKPL